MKEIDDQAIFNIGVERRAAAEDPENAKGLPTLREDAKAVLQEQQDFEVKEAGDRFTDFELKKAAEDIVYKKFAHLQAKQVVDYYKVHIKTWAKTLFTVP